MGAQGGRECAARAQTQWARRAQAAHLTSSGELCPNPHRRASNSPMEESSQISGSSLQCEEMTIFGRVVHAIHRAAGRHARVRGCEHIFEGMGHERRAHRRCSAHSRAAINHNVQVISHRALRTQSRHAPDDDADACSPARSGAGRWENRPSVAPGVGKRWGQARLTCRSIEQAFGGRSTKTRFYSPKVPRPTGESPM